MAGWRRRGEPGDRLDPVELVEIAPDPPDPEGGSAPDDAVDWHRTVRSGAAVVAAVSLLWVGWSVSRQAGADRDQQCLNDVQNAYWRYEQTAFGQGGPGDLDEVLSTEVLDDLVARARQCGASAYADALDRTRPTVDDDEDDD